MKKRILTASILTLILMIFPEIGVALEDSNLVNLEKLEMVSVPGGTYNQTDGKNGFNHTISDFQMAKYEVTYELWYTVYSWALSNEYSFENQGTEGNDGTVGAEPTSAKYEPVTNVTWRDAIVWCNAYSEMMRYTPVYRTGNRTIIKDSLNNNGEECDSTIPNWSANGYRLPTEGEWVYAASYIDGTNWTPYNYASGAYTYYDDKSDTDPYNEKLDGLDACDKNAVYGGYINNSNWIATGVNKTSNVGSKSANQLDIHDMSGNVCEWCWDFSGRYPEDPQIDYKGLKSGTFRTGHGGSWSGSNSGLKISLRYKTLYSFKEYPDWGFRISRIP